MQKKKKTSAAWTFPTSTRTTIPSAPSLFSASPPVSSAAVPSYTAPPTPSAVPSNGRRALAPSQPAAPLPDTSSAAAGLHRQAPPSPLPPSALPPGIDVFTSRSTVTTIAVAVHYLLYGHLGVSSACGWKKVGAGERKYRHMNGILGILIRQHYPGMVTLPGEGNVPEPTRTWDHYKACEDVGVANNIEFHNKAKRVFAELWDFYRCEDGKLEEARAVVNGHCPKLVRSAMHVARPLAVRTYMATQGCKSRNKKAGRKLHLEKEKYMQVAPRWCTDKGECWERIVDYWCSKEYRAVNKDYKNWREAMLDPPHHQGNLNVMEFGERRASHHSAPVPNLFLSYALAHKGPFRSATPYDENDPPTAYTSMTAYDRMEKFKGKAKELKGPEYDVTTEPLDHALVMISGDGRKHAMLEMEARLVEERRLQAEERRLTEERLEARLAEERQLSEARLLEERRLADVRLAEERRLAEKMERALLAQSSQCFAMFAAYCIQNGMPAMQVPHQLGHGSNTDGSSHAPGPSGNNLGGSPNL